jgi:hypothetical protein
MAKIKSSGRGMAGNNHITTASRRGVMIGAPLAAAAASGSASAAESFWTAQYHAKKGDVTLAIHHKRLHAPRPGETKRPVVVHGFSIFSLPNRIVSGC